MFTPNEKAILSHLQSTGPSDLAHIATACDLARSSAYRSLHHLIELQIVEIANQKGKAVYRIVARDALERAARELVDTFKACVFPSISPKTKPKLVFTDCYLLPEMLMQQLESIYNITTYPDSEARVIHDLFVERAQGADVIVRFDNQTVDREFLRKLPNLKAIVFPNCELAMVDYEACKEFGVRIFNPDKFTNKYYATSQVEYILNAALQLIKPLSEMSSQLKNFNDFYDWRQNINRDLFGKKIGLVFQDDNIRTLTQLFQLLGCEVRATNTATRSPHVSEVGLTHYESVEELWEWADLLVALDMARVDLDGLFNLPRCPKYLIIQSGSVRMEQQSIRNVLEKRRVLGLALDVFPYTWKAHVDEEYLKLALKTFEGLSNVIITSEAGIFSYESLARSHSFVFDVLSNLDL